MLNQEYGFPIAGFNCSQLVLSFMLKSFSFLTTVTAATLALAFIQAAASPAQAQVLRRTLGGPVTRAVVGRTTAAATGDGKILDRASTAAGGAGTPSEIGVPTGDGIPSLMQDGVPIDLAAVRRVRVANLLLKAQPWRVGNLDVLAPMQAMLPRLGASLTPAAMAHLPGSPNTAEKDRFFQINLPQGSPIVLTIGKPVAFINDAEQPLRAAPLLVRGEVWLPVFSIAPLLGAAARLAPNGTLHLNPTVQSVALTNVKGVVTVAIKTSAPLSPRAVSVGRLLDPPRLYFDLPGYSMGFDAVNSSHQRVVGAGLGSVLRVRAGLPRKFPDTTRITLDLKGPLNAVSQPQADRTLFASALMPAIKTASRIPAPAVVKPAVLIPPSRRDTLRGLTIVLDAGHGGYDLGARGARSLEKQHNLDIVRRLRGHLMARGADVLLTRDGDYFVSLPGRVHFANSRKADIFFSVHINSFGRNSTGTETFYWSANSQGLASEVQNELAKATGLKNRGIQQARFYVIRNTRMPAVLTESAFISNPREEALLLQPQFRERVAQGMARGIINYAARYLRRPAVVG
jgi:N-acetylmuramoyl-L-alanine amidase